MVRGVHPSHLGRYREIARVLAEEGLGAMAVGLRLPEAARSRESHPDSTMPERLRHAAERLGPAAVKVGQMLSTRPDLIPEEYRVELRRLQDRVEPVPYDRVVGVVAEEIGAEPEVVFARFEREPFASASIGQVHAAQLKEGPLVAVKVQRPEIRATVETDLDIMLTQARRIGEAGLLPPTLDVYGLAKEFASAVRRELDYLHEADNVERFAAAFRDDPTVAVPRVYRAYTTRRVITMARLEGIPFNRLDLIDAARIDRHDLAVRGVNAYLTQIFEVGFFHADPHPGNVFALPGDTIGFTDFGRMGVVSPGVADAAADLLLGVIERDADLALDALLSASRDPARVDADRLRRELSLLIGKYYGLRLADLRVGELIEDLLDLVREHHLSLPSDFVLLLATMAVLEGVGRDLDPSFDFVEAVRPHARRMAAEEFSTEALAATVTRMGRRFARAAADLPSSGDRALRRIADGDFRVSVRPEGYERFLDRAEEFTDRLAFAVLIASFVIGMSTLLSIENLPRWISAVLVIGLLGAVVVSGWVFASLLLARWRGRRPG